MDFIYYFIIFTTILYLLLYYTYYYIIFTTILYLLLYYIYYYIIFTTAKKSNKKNILSCFVQFKNKHVLFSLKINMFCSV